MEPIVFRAVRDIPELGIGAGDDVIFDASAARLFTPYRRVDPGAALLQYEMGNLRPLTPAPLPADLAAVVGLPPRPPDAAVAPPRLLRLK